MGLSALEWLATVEVIGFVIMFGYYEQKLNAKFKRDPTFDPDSPKELLIQFLVCLLWFPLIVASLCLIVSDARKANK